MFDIRLAETQTAQHLEMFTAKINESALCFKQLHNIGASSTILIRSARHDVRGGHHEFMFHVSRVSARIDPREPLTHASFKGSLPCGTYHVEPHDLLLDRRVP